MNLDHLPYFISIASTGSLSAASRQLGVSQPTLSAYLKNLESSLGMELFFRNHRRYIPTPAGKLYLSAARNMLDVMYHTRESIHEPEKRDKLRIGLSPIWGINTLTEIYPELDYRFPHMDFRLQEGYARQLEEYLRTGSLDAAVMTYSNEPPRGFKHIDFNSSEIILTTSAFHPLAARGVFAYNELPIAELEDFRDSVFIMPAPTASLNAMIRGLFDMHDFHPQVMTSSPHIRIVETMIRTSSRVGFMPAYCVRPDSGLAYFRIRSAPTFILSYITHPGHELSEVERYLFYLLYRHERDKDYNTILWTDELRSIVSEFDPVEAAKLNMEQ